MLAVVVMTWWFADCFVDFAGFWLAELISSLVMYSTMVLMPMVGFSAGFAVTMLL